MLMVHFSKAFPDIRYKLFKTFCVSLYGCQLWDLSSKEVQSFYTSWRKAVRYIWRIPHRTHNRLLPLICGDPPVETQIHRRFINFISKVVNSNNIIVKTCGNLVINGSQSSASKSLTLIASKYGLDKHSLVSSCWQSLFSFRDNEDFSQDDEKSAAFIRELCEARDGKLKTNLSRAELGEIIDFVCTS